MSTLQHFFISITLVFCLFSSTAVGRLATATYYNPPYIPSACYGYRRSGVMIAAVSSSIWNNRAACGKQNRVKCLGATMRRASNPCKANKEIVVTIVDYCPRCVGTIDLSRDAFGSIAAPSAGRINREFMPL